MTGSDLQSYVGRTEERIDRVSEAAVARFAATLSIGMPQDVPQGLHWCLCQPETATDQLGVDGHPSREGFLPPGVLPRRMWAASDVEFVSPLVIGAAIKRSSTIASITPKSGKSGALLFVELIHDWRANDALVIRERQTIVYRESAPTPQALHTQGARDRSSWDWSRSITPTASLLFRYSAITFNTHRIHYDLPYATGEEHYPALVVQGPLMATLLLDLCRRTFGANALRRFAFQAVSPAFVDQPLHFVGREHGEALELRAMGADGRTVVSATAQRNEKYQEN